MRDPVLVEQHIQVGICETTLCPVLAAYNIPFVGGGLRVSLPAPGALSESMTFGHDPHLSRDSGLSDGIQDYNAYRI